MAPLVKWHNCYDMLMLKQKMMMILRCYAWKAWKLNLNFIFISLFATLRYAIDTSFYKKPDVSIVLKLLLIYICRKQYFLCQFSRINALIDIEKLTLEQLSTRLLLPFEVHVHVPYCSEKYGSVPHRTAFCTLLIQIFQRINGDWMDYDQIIVRPCTAFVRKCTAIQYRTLL